MGFRFWRRVKILPGMTLNISKKGASLSFGIKGAKFTVGEGHKRATIGIPGTGLFYTQTVSGKNKSADKQPSRVSNIGFFKKLFMPDNEKAFVNGCNEFMHGNEDKAYILFMEASQIADAAFLAGFIALKKKDYNNAAKRLEMCLNSAYNLGYFFKKYALLIRIKIPITEEVSVEVIPGKEGAALGLIEAYQSSKDYKKAISHAKKLLNEYPEDVVVKTSYIELLLDVYHNSNNALKEIINLTNTLENDTVFHTALLYYRSIAFEHLGMTDAALNTLKSALRRRKNRPIELLHAIRYEKAVIYEKIGKKPYAKKEYEKIFSEDPNYRDVTQKLGLDINNQ